MKAEIITIGDEILIGQIVDTNSTFIAKALNKIGISVSQITSVQDEKVHILQALKNAKDILIPAGQLIKERLNIKKIPRLDDLKKFIHNFKNPKEIVTIAMCGKYTELIDSYKSVMEAFVHAGVENNARVNIKWIQTEKIKNLKDVEKVENFVIKTSYRFDLPGFIDQGQHTVSRTISPTSL